MNKALFFDIDGTLVSFKSHMISEQTIASIAKAKAGGYGIFIATGRPYAIIDNLGALSEEGLIDGFITMNGGYVFVGDEVIHSSRLPEAEARMVTDYCGEHHIPAVIVGADKIGVMEEVPEVRALFNDFLKVKNVIPGVTPDEAFDWGGIYQLTPFLTLEQEAELVLPGIESSRWHPAFTDMTARGNNKQLGIDKIIERFGVPLENTMAFGDGGNDSGMLRHAGVGVAMGNANDDVKAAADFVTLSVDEEGITHALEHFGVI